MKKTIFSPLGIMLSVKTQKFVVSYHYHHLYKAKKHEHLKTNPFISSL